MENLSQVTELWQACLVHISSTKTNISKFQLDLETVERRATLWIPLKFPNIYLFYCYLFANLAMNEWMKLCQQMNYLSRQTTM